MYDYVLVVVVKLLAYLKPSFVLSWILWRWIVVYLHACLSTCYRGWELLPTCNCDIYCSKTLRHCIAKQVQFSELIDMWTLSLCSMEDFVWHNPCCLKGECLNCGVDMLMTCLAQTSCSLYTMEVLWVGYSW
jgi:hypothetical protein